MRTASKSVLKDRARGFPGGPTFPLTFLADRRRTGGVTPGSFRLSVKFFIFSMVGLRGVRDDEAAGAEKFTLLYILIGDCQPFMAMR